MKVAVNTSNLHADGVFIRNNCIRDDILLEEAPKFMQQTLVNKNDVLVCSSCFSFLGSEELQLNLLRRRLNRQSLNDLIKSKTCQESIHLCNMHCGEFYCSEACRLAHWNFCHQNLCTGCVLEEECFEHPLTMFKIHAIETNEIFLLVADVFSNLLCSVRNGQSSQEITSYFGKYVHNLWWDVVTVPLGKDPIEFKSTLKNLVLESYGLLSKALKLKENQLDGILTLDFMSRLIGTFEQNNVGISMPSQISVKIASLKPHESDVSRYLEATKDIIDHLDLCCPVSDDDESNEEDNTELQQNNDIDDTKPVSAKHASSYTTNDDEESSSDNMKNEITEVAQLNELKDLIANHGLNVIFPPLDGTAFYTTICKINHSCDPNVLVTYTSSPEKGLVANLKALKDIPAGTELVQSYIDVNLGQVERQLSLEDYGFVCNCSKCKLELLE